MAIDGPETGRPAGRALARPRSAAKDRESDFLVSRGRPQAGEESRTSGCGSRTAFGQIRPLRGRARLAGCRRDGWSLPPEPGGPVTPVVGIMPPMSTQPLRHERFAQAPPLQDLLDLSPFYELKPRRRTPTGRTPKPASEPQLADGDGSLDHGQGGPVDRLGSAARLAGDPQQQPMPPGGLNRDEARWGRRPERPVHPRTRA